VHALLGRNELLLKEGLIGFVVIFGIGYGDITAAIAGELALGTAALLFVGKIVATAGAVGSGGCGGIFAPSLFIGAMGGAAIGALTSLVLPLQRSDVAMLVMTGMAASLGAVIRTPLTCVLLIFEVTNQWVIVPALMLAAIVSQAVSRFVNRHDMYEQIMLQDGLDPHQVLPPRHFKRWREMPVSSLACTTPVTTASVDSAALRELLARSSHQRFPVLNSEGVVVGVLSRAEAERASSGGHPPKLDVAQWISAGATIGDARRAMLAAGVDFLCVGDGRARKLEAILTLHDLVRGESVLDEAE
jgi:CIC family chloride channel protein